MYINTSNLIRSLKKNTSLIAKQSLAAYPSDLAHAPGDIK